LEVLPSYKNGFVCGKENPMGLKIEVFRDKNIVRAEFIPGVNHQGYKGIVHGGIIFSVMDEVMSRAAMISKGILTLTVEVRIKYRKKARIGKKILFSAKMTKDLGKVIETEGKAFSEDGKCLAEAKGKFFEIPKKMEEKIVKYFN